MLGARSRATYAEHLTTLDDCTATKALTAEAHDVRYHILRDLTALSASLVNTGRRSPGQASTRNVHFFFTFTQAVSLTIGLMQGLASLHPHPLTSTVRVGAQTGSEADACLYVEAGSRSCQWWAVGALRVGRMLVGDSVLTCMDFVPQTLVLGA